jgi:hypothetical protein
MSLDTFSRRLRDQFDGFDIPRTVGLAAITDFMRVLHEAFVKSGRSHAALFAQVDSTLGDSATQDLMSLIDVRVGARRSTADSNLALSPRTLSEICSARWVDEDEGQALFQEFLSAFNGERYKDDGSEVSKTWLLYFGVGDEAAYHFGGLFTGDDGGLVGVELEYLDWRLKRFGFLVQMWELEKTWDDEEAAQDAEYQASAEEPEQDPPASLATKDEVASRNSGGRDIEAQILDATVKALIEMPYDDRLSGEDSELETVWEEICAQVQGEYSFYWDAYVETMRAYLAGFLDELSAAEKEEVMSESSDEEIVEALMSGLLARAADYESDNVSRANCWRSEDENWRDA